ncbi:reverse transcriptase domain-containing protein [Tanacetum coccineum]|uniref:Reverse transcriptase domain-containing protein n=1 Tax=Tanacetum coccineum TaxID=301880 RepID=A0ABQ4YIT6_9ASTR
MSSTRLADYGPGPEHADDEIVAEDQPYVEDASPTAQSPDYVPESDPEADPEEDDDEDPKEDPVDYPADGGEDGNDEEGSLEDDEDDDIDIEADDDEDEEEHPAPADSVVVALPATDQSPSAEETESFETNKSTATTPPHPVYRVTARISIPTPVPTPTRGGYGITDSWDEIVETLQGAPVSTDTELGRHMTAFETRVRQDTDEIYTRWKQKLEYPERIGGDRWIRVILPKVRLWSLCTYRYGSVDHRRSTEMGVEDSVVPDCNRFFTGHLTGQQVPAGGPVQPELPKEAGALTWWNSYVMTASHDVAYAMTWADLRKKMTDRYCLRNEMIKLEAELWNLKVKGTDVIGYNQHFQELALLCVRMFPEESDKIERVEVGESFAAATARQPGSTMAHRVDHSFIDTVDTRVRDTERRTMATVEVVNLRVSYQADVCRKESLGFYSRHQEAQEDRATMRAEIEILRRERLDYEQESIETRQGLARSEAYNRALEARIKVLETQTIMATVNQGMSVEEIEQIVAQRVANAIETPAAAEYQRTLTCYECRGLGHYKRDCPELKNQNNGDQAGSMEAHRVVHAFVVEETKQDLNSIEDEIEA